MAKLQACLLEDVFGRKKSGKIKNQMRLPPDF